MIQTEGITKSFGSLQVLKGIDLTIDEGEIVAIVGPSGAGKTTLLQIIGTLDAPDSGKLYINGTETVRLSEEKLEELRGLSDVLLIEADGAKRYPLKVPASWEPVIWEQTDLVIAVVGMDAVGRPIREVCHRPECVADFLGKETEEKLTEEDIVKIVLSTEALRKCVDGREYRVLLNKADIPGKSQTAESIADRLE